MMVMPGQVPNRSEIDPAHTWDMHSIYATDKDWEAAIAEVTRQLTALQQYAGRLSEGPAVLADCLHQQEIALKTLGMIYVYASGFHEVDTSDQRAVAMNDRALSLYAQAMAAISFIEPEMLSLGIETLRAWLAVEPRLALYTHMVDMLAQRAPHVRSAEVEELLGAVSDPFRSATAIHGVLGDADLRFAPARSATPEAEPQPVAQGNIDQLLSNPDRELRRSAYQSYADAHLAFKNTMAACLATGVKQNVFNARARHYSSALEAALAANFIPVEVFHNTLATFRQHLPTWHRYWRLRRRVLGCEHLYAYDIHAPLATDSPHVSFDQALDWICAGLAPLGDEYVRILRKGVTEERWIDIYPNQNKRSGAFSTGMPGTHPFILLNHSDDIYGLSTLAHELGHSLHSYYAWSSQPYVYADYTIFVAEVASNLNQALVRDYLLRTVPDRAFQLATLEEAMSNYHRYFFLMPTLARFELELHERVERGQALTADDLITLMGDLFREGYGDELELDPQRDGITWARFHTHLYNNFYVYQYATGISAAQALASDLLGGVPGATERYLAFLKAGNSLYPLEALQRAGVDLATPEPIERAFADLADIVERLEQLLAEP